jgi:peptidoglycan hydrolase CwlO-like protein
VDKKNLTIILLVAFILVYVFSVHNDRITSAEIRDGFTRLEGRINDAQTELQSLRNEVSRSQQEVAASRRIIEELSSLNRQSGEAINRSEDRVSELEELLREIRSGKQNP